MEIERRLSGGTTRQKVFDGVVGIALPLICLLADPGVFAGWPYRPVIYSFIATELAVLAAWMILQKRLRTSALYFAGPLVAGGGFAFALGVALLPLSVFGLPLLVGFFSFTAFAFARCGLLAFRRGRAGRDGATVAAIVLAGVLFAATPPLAVLYAGLGGTLGGLAESAGGFLVPED